MRVLCAGLTNRLSRKNSFTDTNILISYVQMIIAFPTCLLSMGPSPPAVVHAHVSRAPDSTISKGAPYFSTSLMLSMPRSKTTTCAAQNARKHANWLHDKPSHATMGPDVSDPERWRGDHDVAVRAWVDDLLSTCYACCAVCHKVVSLLFLLLIIGSNTIANQGAGFVLYFSPAYRLMQC